MKSRMDINAAEPGIYKVMMAGEELISSFELDPKLIELIKVRVSQINGCGYCINMHTKDALKMGETTQRLFGLSAWWETPFYSDEERAALRLAEQLTRIAKQGVTDEVYQEALRLLGETKLAQVIFVTNAINNWNRIAIAMHTQPEVDPVG